MDVLVVFPSFFFCFGSLRSAHWTQEVHMLVEIGHEKQLGAQTQVQTQLVAMALTTR